MEHKEKILPPEVLLEMLEQTETVPLTVTGNSMTPFLQPGRDTVYLKKLTDPVRRGQIVLYRRDNGSLILHRVYRVRPEGLELIGDGQSGIEPGIRPEQLAAVACAVRRKGKLLRPGDPIWLFYEKLWLPMIPLRPYIRGIVRRCNRK